MLVKGLFVFLIILPAILAIRQVEQKTKHPEGISRLEIAFDSGVEVVREFLSSTDPEEWYPEWVLAKALKLVDPSLSSDWTKNLLKRKREFEREEMGKEKQKLGGEGNEEETQNPRDLHARGIFKRKERKQSRQREEL